MCIRDSLYVGSYDGHFYALDARTGKPRWVRSLGKKISGAATIVGDLVFVSDLDLHTTWALGANTGATVWKTQRGGFNPVISDGRRIYFAGFSSLFALDHEGRPFDERPGRSNTTPTPTRPSSRPTTKAQRGAARSARRRAAAARKTRARSAKRAARRVRAKRRAANRARAQRERQAKLRNALHGHRHTPRKGKSPPRCHRHKHVYEVRGKTIVLVHNHCHTHVRRR